MDTLDFILKNKLIVIVRGTYGEDLENLAEALYKGGVRIMEVTFDQKDQDCLEKTSDAVRTLNGLSDDLLVGAGTVLTTDQVKAAKEAGAKFIVSPNANEKVISLTKELGMVSIPGAMTPTEILNAHDMGGDIIKLFPSACLGERYIKDILAPISHVRILAAAGITEENFGSFLKLGLCGAGISGRLTDKKLIADKNWEELTNRARQFVQIARE